MMMRITPFLSTRALQDLIKTIHDYTQVTFMNEKKWNSLTAQNNEEKNIMIYGMPQEMLINSKEVMTEQGMI